MRALLSITVALLVLTVTLAVLFDRDPAAPSPALVDQNEAVHVASSSQQVPVVDRVHVELPAASSRLCSVRGRVVDGAGGGLSGAQVSLRGTARGATSGDDGSFVIGGVVALPTASIEVKHPGSATVVRPLTLWPEAQVDVGDLVLHTAARMLGKVVDEHGRPVSDATVSAAGRLAITNADGAFELTGMPAGLHVALARAAGYAARPTPAVQLAVGETVEGIELCLDHARVLSGRLVNQHGAAIADALLEARLDNMAAPLTVRSDEYGRFQVGPLPLGKVQLTVKHGTYLPFGRVYSTGAHDQLITLTQIRAVCGLVVDARTGQPVPVTRVQLLVSSETEQGPWRIFGEPIAQAVDDAAAGRFRIPLGIHTFARVVAMSDGYPAAVCEPFWMGNEGMRGLVLRARAGVRLHGVLRDDRGRPVPGARVDVLPKVGDGELIQTGAAPVLATQVSDFDGAFTSTPLASGRYHVRVRRPGYQHVDVHVDVGTEPLSLQLSVGRAGTIRGRLAQLSGNAPRLRVTATRIDPDGGQQVATRVRLPSARVQGGAFVLAALEPGRYRVQLVGLAKGEARESLASIVEVAVGRESFVEFEALEQTRTGY